MLWLAMLFRERCKVLADYFSNILEFG